MVFFEFFVRGIIVCVCFVNKFYLIFAVKRLDGFGRYDNFKFDINGVRVWRVYGVG